MPAIDGPGKWQVSSQGGYEPRWSPAGNELFFLGIDNGLRVVAVAPGAAPEFGLPERLFVVEGARPRKSYDIGAAGILVRARLPEGETQSFTLVRKLAAGCWTVPRPEGSAANSTSRGYPRPSPSGGGPAISRSADVANTPRSLTS